MKPVYLAALLLLPLCTPVRALAQVSLFKSAKSEEAQLWIKRVRDPRQASKAIRELERIGHPSAIRPLCELYKDVQSAAVLKAIIASMKRAPQHKVAIKTLIKALVLADGKHHHAVLAAGALAEHGVKRSTLPLAKLLDRPLRIASRANMVKIAAIKALARLKDRRAVSFLIRSVERTPDKQDFYINKMAAFALGEIGDPRAVPTLIRALFMSSSLQGSSYQYARVALVKLGKPAVKPLIRAMEYKDAQLNARVNDPGVVLGKTARLLGELRDPAAVEPLLRRLRQARTGDTYTRGIDGVMEGLARIGDGRAVAPLLKLLGDKAVHYKLRVQVCSAMTLLGSKKALPNLLHVARTGTLPGGYPNLREAAVVAYSRLAGVEGVKGIAAVRKMTRALKLKGARTTAMVFTQALDRLILARVCKDDPVCYGREVNNARRKLVQREKAGIMLGILPGRRKALAALIKALPTRQPLLRIQLLQSAKRICVAGDKALIEALNQLVAQDRKNKVRFIGVPLHFEDAIALAVVRHAR